MERPSLCQLLYPCGDHIQLALKLFRGEPAITEFDWNFSAIHNSSPRVARRVGSVLPLLLQRVQPGHGLLTRFRVMCMPLNALFRLGFPMPSDQRPLSSRHTAYSQAHSSIGTLSSRRTPAHCKHTVSDTISLPSRAAFHLSLMVLVHYRSQNVFSLIA